MLKIKEIMEVLPHRYPFLMVDQILEVEAMHRVVGSKNFTINEPFFQGHFPQDPIVPGMMILESMAQIGGFVFDIRNAFAYVVAINNAKFRERVIPGDVLVVEATVVAQVGQLSKVKATAKVDDKVVAAAEITYSFVAAKQTIRHQ